MALDEQDRVMSDPAVRLVLGIETLLEDSDAMATTDATAFVGESRP